MTKMNIALAAAALSLPVLSFVGSAEAASAHNIQTGAHTSNAYDDAASAYEKQVRANHAPAALYQQFYGSSAQ